VASRAIRREDRQGKGFGNRRSHWYRQAVSPYTWVRTDGGPQKDWLHRIGKATDPLCPCGHTSEDGYHLTFVCLRFKKERAELLGNATRWEDIDAPVWSRRGGSY